MSNPTPPTCLELCAAQLMARMSPDVIRKVYAAMKELGDFIESSYQPPFPPPEEPTDMDWSVVNMKALADSCLTLLDGLNPEEKK